MRNFTPADAEMLQKEAHQVYLDNWETKTRFAENNCEWNSEIHHRSHEAIENLSSTVQHLAHLLEEAMTRIDQLEATVNNSK